MGELEDNARQGDQEFMALVSNFLLGSPTSRGRALARRFGEGRLVGEEEEATCPRCVQEYKVGAAVVQIYSGMLGRGRSSRRTPTVDVSRPINISA